MVRKKVAEYVANSCCVTVPTRVTDRAGDNVETNSSDCVRGTPMVRVATADTERVGVGVPMSAFEHMWIICGVPYEVTYVFVLVSNT